ncbi:MAG: FAD-dependent oxidoreductase [Aigarchaeota archaeon]|nr:FAD-dependent oxidoreductase [Aigarchaeota archaeon]MCX8193446.1 FAD-dependent oxidoreductase [Nitrososphaeria archaeon]MDW7985822.1 FAD-dependent oxidoreductase [Nitrososphaerota archaeon]
MSGEASEKKASVSRRVFLSATAAGVAGLVVGGIIGSQAFPREIKITETKTETTTLTKPTTITQISTTTTTVTAEPGILTPPPPIPDEKIAETITADVVIVGAGLAGLMAAYSAAEEKAVTVVIEKYKGPNVRGAHINPGPAGKLFKEAGITVDYEKAVREQVDIISGNKVDESLVRLWLANSSKIADFIADLARANGIPAQVLKPKTYLEDAWKDWPRPTYKFSDETDFDGVAQLAPLLEKIAKDKGAKFYYNTTAVQLIRVKAGRVTGVIAQDVNGRYIKFNANKAVILCTGDYSSNKDLLKLWAPPEVARLVDMPNRVIYPMITPTNTGDGQLMGLWIGAALDEPPHCPLCYIMTGGDLGFAISSLAGFGPGKGYMLICNPFLFVNILGERFTNEALPWMWAINRVLQQPKAMYWAVLDSTWEEQVTKHGGGYRRITDPALGREFLEGSLQNKAAVTANTIEELARKMEVPVETFKKTVERYNELCKKGVDEDYGKPSRYMVPVEKPPFYAIQAIAVLLNMVGGGLKVNNKLQVLDKEGKPIPGLYAAGNAAGSFYAQYYSLVVIPGLSHSRAVTFGYLAGKNAVRG